MDGDQSEADSVNSDKDPQTATPTATPDPNAPQSSPKEEKEDDNEETPSLKC